VRPSLSHAPFRVFIGYDRTEPVAYHVLSHSILTRATMPVSITPLFRDALAREGFTRARGPLESTDFSISRFLVPHLSDYHGWSLFLDCDMLCTVDLAELIFEMLHQPDKAVLVCQHDYTPATTTKFHGQTQTAYPRKNWSSCIAFNNARCAALTPDYVNTATGLELHRFTWIQDEQIGTLPLEWNWLVGEYPSNNEAKILHYTTGGPWFAHYALCDHADLWRAERNAMLSAKEGVPSESVTK